MENSPLELYETAYRLHYVENKIPDALRYYEALLKEFPESNECGYAVIQIQKIKSNDVADSLAGGRGGAHPIAAVAFLLCLLIIAALAIGGLVLQDKLNTAQKQASFSVRALGNMLNGDDAAALKLLDDMKSLSRADITPYELSAQIYRKAGKTEKARAEYDTFFSLNPEEMEKYKPVGELVPDPPADPDKKLKK